MHAASLRCMSWTHLLGSAHADEQDDAMHCMHVKDENSCCPCHAICLLLSLALSSFFCGASKPVQAAPRARKIARQTHTKHKVAKLPPAAEQALSGRTRVSAKTSGRACSPFCGPTGRYTMTSCITGLQDNCGHHSDNHVSVSVKAWRNAQHASSAASPHSLLVPTQDWGHSAQLACRHQQPFKCL